MVFQTDKLVALFWPVIGFIKNVYLTIARFQKQPQLQEGWGAE